jgi:DNA-binding transcriptional ArsR family regulator
VRWSQLKSQLTDLIAPPLRDRIALHQARYRYTREEVGRVWLTIDGREIASFDTSTYERRKRELAQALAREVSTVAADALAREELREAGQYGDAQAIAEIERYLGVSIDDALQSSSPLTRALAVIDRRVGKRRLASLAANQIEHPLVRQLLRVRLDAEGLAPATAAQSEIT